MLKVATAQFENVSGDKEITIANLNPEALENAGGSRYIKARRPDLYKEILSQDHDPEQKVVWMK